MSTTTLAQCAARLDGDDWLQVFAADASILLALDSFFSHACATQTKRHGHSKQADDDDELMHSDARLVFALYMRLLREIQDTDSLARSSVDSMRSTLLHLTRLLPFCQLYGRSQPDQIRQLLTTASSNISSLQTEFKRIRGVIVSHLNRVHDAVALNKRPQIVELIRTIHDTAVTVHALALAEPLSITLFGEHETDILDSESLLRALAVCYECDLPQLQRNLSKLDDTAQKNTALLVPEGRRVLLQVLSNVVSFMMTREQAAGGTGESVLSILHDLSHGTDAETVDHGSFVSDLWHLCGYEAKLLEFFDRLKLDRDNVSYLEVVLEGLPRRRVIDEPVATLTPSVEATVAQQPQQHAPPSQPMAKQASVATPVADELTPLIMQAQDLFPDLGDGYVALCLLASQRQLETVINYLLESNPPPSVAGVRRDLKRSDAEYKSLERQALGEPVAKSEKVDPSRIWVGKRTQEKAYDPRVARKDPSIVEKTMQIVDEYAEEESFREAYRAAQTKGNSIATEKKAHDDTEDDRDGLMLDEYDDDYNDEYEDYEPFSVHDSGHAEEDLDAIRLQNRRLRAMEAEDAFWEGMRNHNRRTVDEEAEEEEEEDDIDGAEEETKAPTRWSRPEWTPSPGHGARGGSGGRGGGRGSGGGRGGGRGGGGGEAAPLTEQQVQRQRQRQTQNKAKVANHHRKERALKKRG